MNLPINTTTPLKGAVWAGKQQTEQIIGTVRYFKTYVDHKSRPYVTPLAYSHWRHVDTCTPSLYKNGDWLWGYPVAQCVRPHFRVCSDGLFDTPEALMTYLSRKTASKISDKWYKDSLRLGADFAELPETVGWMISTTDRLRRAANATRRGRIKEALHTILGYPPQAKVPRHPNVPRALHGKRSRDHSRSMGDRIRSGSLTASGAWLEMTYAVNPLVGSIYDYAGTVQDGLKADTSARLISIQSFNGKGIDRYDYMNHRTIHTGKCFGSVRSVLNVNVVDPKIAALDHLGLLNPLSWAFEIVKFGWLVDWFIPISRNIASLNRYAGCTTRGFHSFKYNYEASASCAPTPSNGQVIDIGYVDAFGSGFIRKPWNGSVPVVWDTLEARVGTHRLLTSISLLTQALVKLRGK